MQRKRRKNPTPQQVIAKKCRDRFYKVVVRMKRGVKLCNSLELIGCTIEELKVYLENRFVEGMNWLNHGNGPGSWNIDHIIPLVTFNLFDLEEQKKAFHYTNLRPLWFEENMARCRKNYIPLAEQKEDKTIGIFIGNNRRESR